MAERPIHAWTSEALSKRLASIELTSVADETVDPIGRDWPFVAAAAVLSTFEPAKLHGLSGALADSDALARLLDQCAVAPGTHPVRWRLEPPSRAAALRRLGDRDAMTAALAANPERPEDQLQVVLEGHIRGTAPPLNELDTQGLACTLEAAKWLHGVLDGVPDPEHVRRALDRAYLMEPFETLAGHGFSGRDKELARLRRYVGEREPAGALEGVGRALRWGVGMVARRPLLIRGPGGVGKSTLLAKFILEHATASPGERVLFAYVDFDRADVTPVHPASILFEAARQLAAQHGPQRDRFLDFRQRWSRRLATSNRRDRIEALSSAGAGIELGDSYALEACVGEFAEIAASAFGGEEPVVLVLDTFEEVQYRSSAFVETIWDLLIRVQSSVPALRTVIAGRVPLGGSFPTEDLELPPLDAAAAAELLRVNGVQDAATARTLVRRFGGNPLTLRLAATVVCQDTDGIDAIGGIRRPVFLKRLFDAREEAVQAQLYGRILRHVHSADVAKLAHPGLIVRRITPEVIAEVLAAPCGLDAVDESRAMSLFADLRREVTLVTLTPDGALEHRADVRRVMLPLLRADEGSKVHAIHEAAVSYYEHRPGVIARAEELYHRLALDQPTKLLDGRWDAQAGERLRTALDDLPARAQTYLASRLGIEVNPEIWKHASLEDLERRVESEARDLLGLGRPDDAQVLLAAHAERTDASPLYALEAIAARQLGDYTLAEEIINRGLDSGHGVGTTRTELELLQLSAMLLLEVGDITGAIDRLQLAHSAALWLRDSAQADEIAVRLRELMTGATSDLEGSWISDQVASWLPTPATAEGSIIATPGEKPTSQANRERPSATTDNPTAGEGERALAYTRGLRLREEGDLDGALSWFEQGARGGDVAAAYNLGVLLRDRGDLDGAVHWLEQGAQGGDLAAAYNLGLLLRDRGDVNGALFWLGKGADGGDLAAAYTLGVLLRDRGDVDGALFWLGKGAQGGDSAAAYTLGVLLRDRGDFDGALLWFKEGAQAGDVAAAYNLGVLLRDRGDVDGAVHWLEKGAQGGDLAAAHDLGVLLAERGDRDGARRWLAKAGESQPGAA